MTYQIVIEPQAALDMQIAIDYYDSRQSGLGQKFYNTLVHYIETLSSNPFYQIRYKNTRSITIKPFSFYQIIYVVDEKVKTIYVIAVFNSAQDPDKISTR